MAAYDPLVPSAAARALVSVSILSPGYTPVSTSLVYNGVDMPLCFFVFKYLQSKMPEQNKANAAVRAIFYSRCIGCISGIAATHLFCEKPIHPLFAVSINVAALMTCFFTYATSLYPRKKSEKIGLW